MSPQAPIRNRGIFSAASLSPTSASFDQSSIASSNAPSGSSYTSTSSSLPPPGGYSRSGKMSGGYPWWRVKRLLTRPLIWVIIIIVGAIGWWSRGASHELQSPEVQLRLREIFPPEITKDLQFFPASNHKIHYVGRWITAPNRLRFDGSFPGVYFDLNITNTTTLILSLQNTKNEPTQLTGLPPASVNPTEIPHAGQYSFSAASRLRVGSPPISLLALVDGEEYVVLPNATSLVPIRTKDLDIRFPHTIRIIAPMTDNNGTGIVQFDGLWIDKGGQLLPVEGSVAQTHSEDEDIMDPEDDQSVGKKHRLGLGRLLQGYKPEMAHRLAELDASDAINGYSSQRRKLVEVITDSPSHLFKQKTKITNARTGGADGLLAGVKGWEYLLGEMFSVDHVCVGVEGMCLIQNCLGGTGEPSGMGDVFFRSGPVGNPHFGHQWPFQSYVPDVVILNLGTSDFHSFENFGEDYNKTGSERFSTFEDTYVSLVKAIRNLAYQIHPATIEMERLGADAYAENNAPANIPIFVMRPFLGELEHATQGAVNRLREDGDKSVFWLDTSGWLDQSSVDPTKSDFFEDKNGQFSRWYLTERGNQKVAIYLHMHTCRYLAADDEKCAFLPPEIYQGNVYDRSQKQFDNYLENEKERQMKQIFWEGGGRQA